MVSKTALRSEYFDFHRLIRHGSLSDDPEINLITLCREHPRIRQGSPGAIRQDRSES